MADWELIQERKVSGKGVLKIPDDKKKNRAYILYGTVIRIPKNKYLNLNWNPGKSRYANLAFVRQGYVLHALPMEYDSQVWDGVNDISGQTLIAVKCAYQGLLQSFYEFSQIVILGSPLLTAGQVQPVSITNLIQDYENLRLAWDELRIQCYADTAVNFKLYALKYDTCDPLRDKDKPPPSPPPIPPVPPGTPIPNSDPYQEDTRDNNNSVPYPGDEPVPPSQGVSCTPYNVVFQFTNNNGDLTVRSTLVYGKIGTSFRVVPNIDGEAFQLQIQHQGIPNQDPCGEFRFRRITGAGSDTAKFTNPSIISVTPQ